MTQSTSRPADTVLFDAAHIDARHRLVLPGAPLAALYEGLAAELEPVLAREPYLPEAKALLSRAGGRCAADGATLVFDPFSPHRHRCPACNREYDGELHHLAWILWYQLWLAERAVHAALFANLRGDERHARFAREVLGLLADRYLAYPNVDNVLGPSRLFFSTYLESIWLLQVCVASSCMEALGDTALAERVRERIVDPARAMIAEYNEGLSNRQVWNNAALLAAGALCRDLSAADRYVEGAHGLRAHLAEALLADGSWYEGENYHQFALRGLWYGVTVAERQGAALTPRELTRFHAGFGTMFATALPDFTMPSRKDSQYAVSLRQWRMAELAELGYTRSGDPALADALARCYAPGHARRETGRCFSTADVERNAVSGALTRADLGWRGLLFAVPTLDVVEPAAPRSAHLRAQGFAVFRRPREIYVGFDYGQSGGGHGHPDRLNITLYQRDVRWLDDLGTGSYVDASLHWYRSTLAHNAPLVDGRSQPARDGALIAYDEREGLGWISARFECADPAVEFRRSVIVAPGYLIDELAWSAGDASPRVELPIHLDGTLCERTVEPVERLGGPGLEDGFAYVRDAAATPLPAGECAVIEARRSGLALRARVEATADATLFAVSGPGQPASEFRRFFVVSVAAQRGGAIRTVLAWDAGVVVESSSATEVVIRPAQGERHVHSRIDGGWRVDLFAAGARSSVDLVGVVSPAAEPPATPMPSVPRVVVPRSRAAPAWYADLSDSSEALRFTLGRRHYRQSEASWEQADSPTARVAIAAEASRLVILADVRAGAPKFVAADATNPFDNEHPDTLGAGLQLYARLPAGPASWILVPEPGGRARVRRLSGAGQDPVAHWRGRPGGGYEVRIELPLPPDAATGEFPFDMDLIVNETVAGRVRRRGQLVLSGAEGEWVYLRGARHESDRWLPMVIR